MGKPPKHGKIAFITTPEFRKHRKNEAEDFVYRHMYSLCRNFTVLTTGRTRTDLLDRLLSRPFSKISKHQREYIGEDMKINVRKSEQLKEWRKTIRDGLEVTMARFPGMIHIAYELVEGRLNAVLHLTDWMDKSGKPDSAVLSREANVHNVPSATDIDTATAFIESWHAKLARQSKHPELFPARQEPKNPPLQGIEKGHRVLALVAHDNMKMDMCCFAVEHAAHIFERYDYILATGTTGSWLRKFMSATGRGLEDIRKIRLCNSGPLGGDLQIAYAIVKGLCQEIVFLQDPSVSHAHDSDIKLFEQAVLSDTVKVRLATNLDSAELLIGL